MGGWKRQVDLTLKAVAEIHIIHTKTAEWKNTIHNRRPVKAKIATPRHPEQNTKARLAACEIRHERKNPSSSDSYASLKIRSAWLMFVKNSDKTFIMADNKIRRQLYEGVALWKTSKVLRKCLHVFRLCLVVHAKQCCFPCSRAGFRSAMYSEAETRHLKTPIGMRETRIPAVHA